MKDDATCCAILVGGLGTRLRAAVPDLPKPMAPVRGRPFLEYLLADLKKHGLKNIVFCVGYQAEKIENHFGGGKRFGLHLEYSRERELRGTAGALKLAQPLISSENFLLLNGDCYNDVDFQALLSCHGNTPAIATLVAASVEDRARFGSLELDAKSRVVGFHEKGATTGAGFINAGCYVFNQKIFDLIPEEKVWSLERDVFSHLVARGEILAYKNQGDFIDIGLPKEWKRAENVLPALPEIGENHLGN